MAEVKKTATTKAATAKATTAKAVVKKAPAAKTTVKKETVAKTVTKKAPATKKAAVKEKVNFEFCGKSYTPEDLLNICKDVWKYDLNGKDADLRSIDLYVKPEENAAYYVINGDVSGSFSI